LDRRREIVGTVARRGCKGNLCPIAGLLVKVTHHIGPDLDAERDRLPAGLQQAAVTEKVFWLDGFQQLQGKNGGGDSWHTDRRLEVVELR